jgi:hypothetical protein
MNSDDYEIIDNFLDKSSFNNLKEAMLSNDFPWYYNDGVVNLGDTRLNQYQFTHTFYKDHFPFSQFFEAINPIIKKINPVALIRVKANLNTRTEEIFEHGYHADYINPPSNQRTAVFYLNTNNGFTIFEDGTKIESVENRLVSFKTPLLHTGTTCTDVNRRVLINFNYII